MRTTRLLPVLAAATLSIGVLAGCGPQGAATDVRPVAELTDDSFASSIGTAVAEAGSAHVEAKGSLMGLPLNVEGDVTGGEEPQDFALALASADGGIDVRLVDQVAYGKVDPFTGGKFLRIDLTDADDPLVAQLKSFTDQVDAKSLLADLDGAISIEATGDEPVTLDGVETTAYEVTVDTTQLPGADVAGQRPTSIELTVQMGADDLPRRIVMDQGGAPITVDFSAWGEPVEVAAPAADEVSEQSVSSLLGGFAPVS